LVFLLVALFVMVVGEPWYIVNESQQVVITRFGATLGRPVTTPGLKTKIPFVDRVNPVDSRILEWDGGDFEVPTRDKRFLVVNTCARWRIVDPVFYYQRWQHERGAVSRLDDIIDGETRNVLSNHDLIEIVRSSNREFEWSEVPDRNVPRVTNGRALLEREILNAAATRTEVLGIEIVDFRIKRINYLESDRKRVYDRMISERLQLAEKIRADGEAEAERIRRGESRR
jgi:membrane protease subunit HflC